jgi:prophage regulatory protein
MDNVTTPRTSIGLVLQPAFLRLPDVLALIPVSKSTWWAGVKAGRYPRGVKLSSRTTAWRRRDIEELVSILAHPD